MLMAFLVLGACEVLGQQTYLFSNRSSGGVQVNAPVFNGDGSRLSGTNYVAMLYWGTTPDTLAPAFDRTSTITMEPTPFTYMPNGQAGYFRYQRGFAGVPICPPDEPWLQVRAWDLRLGATYENVLSQNIGGYGVSPIFQTPGGDACNLVTPEPPRSLIGLQSFSLSPVVPEPSSALLLLLGLAWNVWRWRWKR